MAVSIGWDKQRRHYSGKMGGLGDSLPKRKKRKVNDI